MQAKTQRVVAGVVIAAFVAGCAEMNKTQMGAIVGAAAGVAAGVASGDDSSERMRKALLFGIAGAGVGAAVGKLLDDKDKQRLSDSTLETLESGESRTFSNPATQVRAATKVQSTVTETRPTPIPVLKNKVKQVPPMDLIGRDFAVVSNANVRGGPGQDFVIVDSLKQGGTVRVVGKVTGADWYMVAKNDIGSGFVATRLLGAEVASPAKTANWATAAGSKPTGPAAGTSTVQPAEVAEFTVPASTTCRVVTQTVTRGSETATENVKACKGPDGWRVVPA